MNISELILEKKVSILPSDALIIVDIQNDFIPGGALAVKGGHEIIQGTNQVSAIFKRKGARIILTQDWHPLNHKSFASAHPGKKPFEAYSTAGIGPVLWPDHCVQGEKGADFSKQLNTKLADAIIRKGMNPEIDSYSTFLENDKKSETGLSGYLKSLKIFRFFICGLALDYCVYYSALDGRSLGFEVYVIIDLTRGIDDPPGRVQTAIRTMTDKGIKFLNSAIL
jgi:nicotinamidase/pyrazinamidase